MAHRIIQRIYKVLSSLSYKVHTQINGTDFTDRIGAKVALIRKRYSKDVPIILSADIGFAD